MEGKKCMVCERRVSAKEWAGMGVINAAVAGEAIVLRGHTRCVRNVDDLVVTPGRIVYMEDVGGLFQAIERAGFRVEIIGSIDKGPKDS